MVAETTALTPAPEMPIDLSKLDKKTIRYLQTREIRQMASGLLDKGIDVFKTVVSLDVVQLLAIYIIVEKLQRTYHQRRIMKWDDTTNEWVAHYEDDESQPWMPNVAGTVVEGVTCAAIVLRNLPEGFSEGFIGGVGSAIGGLMSK